MIPSCGDLRQLENGLERFFGSTIGGTEGILTLLCFDTDCVYGVVFKIIANKIIMKKCLIHICLCAALCLAAIYPVVAAETEKVSAPTTVLYNKVLNSRETFPELIPNNTPHKYTENGLEITGKGDIFRLGNYYSLGERLIRYHLRFSPDAKAIFRNSSGDFGVVVSVPEKKIAMSTVPPVDRKVDFLDPSHDYLLGFRIRIRMHG